MRFDDLLLVSLRQVFRHRRRYFGVVMAIALGVTGFTTVITIGRDVKKNFNQDIELIGTVTLIRCYFDPDPSTSAQWFRPAAVAALRRLPQVQEVSQWGERRVLAVRQGQRHPTVAVAVDEFFWNLRNYHPAKGSFFGAEAVSQRRREAVLGSSLAEKVFGHNEVVGQNLEVDQELYRIVGLLEHDDYSTSSSLFLPLTTAQDRLLGETRVGSVVVRCHTWDDVEQVAAAIPAVVQAHQPVQGLRVWVCWDALSRVRRVAWWVEFFVYLASASTLMLGGFGIWNVMMAAVQSRTREIGLKKAMGAEDRDILAQFLTEALILSLGSALLGLGLGRLLVALAGAALGNRPQEELFIGCLGISLLVAFAMGLGAGLYPSLKASRMEVVSATRYE